MGLVRVWGTVTDELEDVEDSDVIHTRLKC